MTTHDVARAARLSSSGEAIVACGADVALCATRDATVALRLGDDVPGAPRGLLHCCDFDKSSRLVVCGGEGGVLDVWDCKRRRVVRTLEDHGSSVAACRFDSTSTTVASGNTNGEVLVHKVRSRSLLALLHDDAVAVNVVEYSPLRPHHLGALHADGSLRLWDVENSKKVTKLGGGRDHADLLGLAFSPVNAKFLAAAKADGAVAFWDIDRGVCVKNLDVGGQCTSIAFATERVVVVGTDDGRIVAYDLRSTAAPISHHDAHDGAVRSLQFVDAALPRPRIAASPARAATPPRVATPQREATPPRTATPSRDATLPRSPVASPPQLPAVEPEAPPPPPSPPRPYDPAAAPPPPHSPARMYREKQAAASPEQAPQPARPPAGAATAAAPPSTTTGAPAPAEFFEALDDVADELRASIQNLHVDILRQFQIQKSEVSSLLEEHRRQIAELLRGNSCSRRENEDLRLPW